MYSCGGLPSTSYPREQRQTDTHTHTLTHTHTHSHTHTRELGALAVRGARGGLKVLWAVISKTIPWMAALIENNEGHIEHMVAVVSPFPPFFFFFFFFFFLSFFLPLFLL